MRSADEFPRAPAVRLPDEHQTPAFAPPVGPAVTSVDFPLEAVVTGTGAQAIAPTSANAPRRESPVASDVEGHGLDASLRGLAELALLPATKAPMTLALLGSAGSGKSFALGRLLDLIGALSTRTAARVVIARVAAVGGRDPASALAASVFAALSSNPATAALAHEAAAAGADPHAAARSAGERLVELRRRLDVERQALQDLNGRKARLPETVLYRATGSRIDGWARANRSRIESRLRAFGFPTADPVATYKDLVRDLSERRGLAGRLGAFLHAMWGFGAQFKLLVYAALLALLAWGVGVAETPGGLIDSLQGRGESMAGVGSFLEGNKAWLGMVRSGALWLAAALVALNMVRAGLFVSPLFRGVGLLDTDVQASQRDLDSMIVNQARLVDSLSGESDTQAHRVEEAERRLAMQGARSSAAVRESTPFDEGVDAPAKQARAFFTALSREIADDASGAAPQRIVVAVDELDALSPRDAAAFVDEAALVLGRAPFVTLLAVDAKRLVAGWDDGAQGWGADGLARRVQAGVRVDAAPPADYTRLVRRLLGDETAEAAPETFATVLDQPLSPEELRLLEKLAPLAGRTPRQVEQFVTAYRLGRTQTQRPAALAFALALQTGGAPDERSAYDQALAGALPLQAIGPLVKQSRISDALQAAMEAQNAPFTISDMRDAQALASRFSLTA